MHNPLGFKLKQLPTWVISATFFAALLATTTAWSQAPMNSGNAMITLPVANAASLDGRQFKAGIVRKDADEGGENLPLDDQLMFRDGKFSSAVCKRYNFADAPYWVRVEGDQIHFLAELTSPTDGRMQWKGTIRGNTLEGTMRWTKKRWYWTINTEHRISGTLENGLSAASSPSN